MLLTCVAREQHSSLRSRLSINQIAYPRNSPSQHGQIVVSTLQIHVQGNCLPVKRLDLFHHLRIDRHGEAVLKPQQHQL